MIVAELSEEYQKEEKEKIQLIAFHFHKFN